MCRVIILSHVVNGIEVIVEKCLIIMFLMLIHLENDIFTAWLLINQWKRFIYMEECMKMRFMMIYGNTRLNLVAQQLDAEFSQLCFYYSEMSSLEQ